MKSTPGELIPQIDLAIAELINPLILDDIVIQEQIEEVLKCFLVSGENVLKLKRVFLEEMERGLHDEPSSLAMINTYIPELPNGKEEGEYLALDLGGTNMRVVLVTFRNGLVSSVRTRYYDIPRELRLGCGIALFDHLASCISDFVRSHGLSHRRLPLGFTFSFPVEQHGLDIAVLTVWTKTFTASSVEGNDVVAMLKAALNQRGDCNVDVVAILNDTTGTLVHGATIDQDTMIGLVLGTGSNAAYMESADRVTHWDTIRHGEKQVIINIEWGALGDNGLLDFIKTDFDRQVDKNSLIANSFTFEKYISGKYMGEIVRTVLVNLAHKNLLFTCGLSSKLEIPNTFTTNFVSHIEQDTVSGSTSETEKVLNSFDQQYSMQDLHVVKMVCEVVSLRAALLVSACLSVLLKRINKDKVTIAVDGSLFKYHPRFKLWMGKLISLLAPDNKFKLSLVEDGSSKGGAMTAAIGIRIRDQN